MLCHENAYPQYFACRAQKYLKKETLKKAGITINVGKSIDNVVYSGL